MARAQLCQLPTQQVPHHAMTISLCLRTCSRADKRAHWLTDGSLVVSSSVVLVGTVRRSTAVQKSDRTCNALAAAAGVMYL